MSQHQTINQLHRWFYLSINQLVGDVISISNRDFFRSSSPQLIHPPAQNGPQTSPAQRRTVALVAQLGVGASAEQGGGAEAEALRKRWSFCFSYSPKSHKHHSFFVGFYYVLSLLGVTIMLKIIFLRCSEVCWWIEGFWLSVFMEKLWELFKGF